MKVEVFALCDAATDYRGKLNILGTFDQIYAAKVPVTHPACAIALRLRFTKMEEGMHKVCIRMVDPDGALVFRPVDGSVNPRMGEDTGSVAVNLILNFQNIKLPEFADYQIDLIVDDEAAASLPLRVREIMPPKQH